MSSAARSAVVLDPYPLWIEAVSAVLRNVGFEVKATATSPKDGLDAVASLKPDLLTLEIEGYATGGDGIGCLARAKALHRDVQCVVLSSRVDTRAVQEALAAGAASYVVKVAHPDDLASAVRQAFEHSVYFAPLPYAPGPEAESTREGYGGPDVEPEPGPEPGLLTRRELEILAFVANGSPNASIASKLWITEQTVKFHLSNIFRKLDVSNRTEAARWAHVNGVVPDEPRALSVVS